MSGWDMSPDDRAGYKPSHMAGGRWDSPGSSSGNSDFGGSGGRLGWSDDRGSRGGGYGGRGSNTDSLFGGEPLFGDDGGDGGSGPGWDIDIKATLKEKEKKRKKAERAERARKKKERKLRGSAQDRVAERLKKMREERENRLSTAAAEQAKAEEDARARRRQEAEDAERQRVEEAEAAEAKKARKAAKKAAAATSAEGDHPARGHASKSLDRSFSDLSDISESDFIPGAYAAKRKKELAEKRMRAQRGDDDVSNDDEGGEQRGVVKMPKNPTLEGLRGGVADLSDTLGGTGVMIGSVEGPAASGFAANRNKPLSPSKMSFSAYAELMKAPVEVPNVGVQSVAEVGDDDEEDRTPEATLDASGKNAVEEIAQRNNKDEEDEAAATAAAADEEEAGPETVSPDVSPRVSQDASKDTSGFSGPVAKMNNNNNDDDDEENAATGPIDDPKASTAEGASKLENLSEAASAAKAATALAKPVTASQELYVARKAQRDRWNVANGIPPSPMREPEVPASEPTSAKPAPASAPARAAAPVADSKPAGFFTQLKEIKEEVRETIAPPVNSAISPPRGPPVASQRGANPEGSPGPPPPPPAPRASSTSSSMIPPRSSTSLGTASWARQAAAAQLQRESSGGGIRSVQNVGGTPVPATAPTLPPNLAQQQQRQQQQQRSATVSLSPSTVSAVSAAQYGQVPPQNAGTEGAAANVQMAPELEFNTRADALAWEIREARLEEELDRAHTKLEEMGHMLVRKDAEIARVREGAAHHRQRAVEARLELQEMKGSSALRNSRLRKSAQIEKEKRLAERSFQSMRESKEKKEEATAQEVYDAPPTAAQLRDIEREMQLQETLIKGYQRENERLVQESREVKAKAEETQRRMFEEHERLSATLNNLRNRMVSTAGEEGAAAHDAATDVGGGGSLNAALARASTANKLENELEKDAQIAQLKEDLLERKRIAKEARDEHKLEVQELQRELRTVKDSMIGVRKAAERAGQNSAADSTAVALLQADLEAERRRHQEAEQALQRRVAFFAENQEIIDSKEGEVAQQREVIIKLKKRLASLEALARAKIGEAAVNAAVSKSADQASVSASTSSPGRGAADGPHRNGGRSLRDIKRIKELEGQLTEMADAMRKRNPNSVAALLHASAPPKELLAERDSLAAKVTALQVELKSINDTHTNKMRSFRQEHERMRADYEKVMSRNNAPTSASATPGRGSSKSRRVAPSSSSFEEPRSLSEDVQDGQDVSGTFEGETRDDVQRRWFQKKIQEMQRKCEAQVRAAKRGTSSEDVQAMQKRIRSQDKELERLREELISAPAGMSTSTAVSVVTDGTTATTAAALRRAKEMHERQMLAQAEEHQATVARLRIELLASSKSLAAARSDMHDVKAAAAAAATAATPASAAGNQLPEIDSQMEQALAVANSQVMSTKALLEDCNRRLDDSRSHVASLTGEVSKLRAEAAAPATPALVRITALEQKIFRMEAHYRSRELELQNVVDAVSQRGREELLAVQRRHDIAIAGKNAEVQRFRQELDALLHAVKGAKRRRQHARQQQGVSP